MQGERQHWKTGKQYTEKKRQKRGSKQSLQSLFLHQCQTFTARGQSRKTQGTDIMVVPLVVEHLNASHRTNSKGKGQLEFEKVHLQNRTKQEKTENICTKSLLKKGTFISVFVRLTTLLFLYLKMGFTPECVSVSENCLNACTNSHSCIFFSISILGLCVSILLFWVSLICVFFITVLLTDK